MAQPAEVRKLIKNVRLAQKMASQAVDNLVAALGEDVDDEVPDFEMNGFMASEQQRRAREAAHFGRALDEDL